MRPAGTERSILHVDMDSFYASVEVLHDPELAGRPVVVGAAGSRGVVASCTYEARVFGIHSAMPSAHARRLCPDAVFVPAHPHLYAAYSRRLHDLLTDFTPLVEGIGLDEAFVDVTGARRLFGPAPAVAARIREKVAEELKLACAVGVGTSKLVAKLASRKAKPRVVGGRLQPGAGVFVVMAGEELDFLHRHPVAALWGVGPATEPRLHRLGVATVGDLAAVPRSTLVAALGASLGSHLHELSWGRDDQEVVPHREPKSVGHEQTYPRDLVEVAELRSETVRMADSVAARLRHGGLGARTVTVKVRFSDFATITRSQTLRGPVDTALEVAAAAHSLLDAVDPTPGVRLLGISVSTLSAGGSRQLSLDKVAGAGGDSWSPAWGEAWQAVDEVRRRFGESVVRQGVGRDGRSAPGP
ncbi:MAG TPA: DNA polymerase IV [Acidimicrobiales bacterium]|nr:DNA polymerase IV [Acidimicrobiales bacterium]